MGKTNPLNDADLEEFVELQASRASADEGPETKQSWNVDTARSLSTVEVDLSVKNPIGAEEIVHAARRKSSQRLAVQTRSARRCWRRSRDCYEGLVI